MQHLNTNCSTNTTLMQCCELTLSILLDQLVLWTCYFQFIPENFWRGWLDR